MFTSQNQFEETIFVNAAPEVCSAALFEPENYPKLHPLIQRVEGVSRGQDGMGKPTCTFYAIDHLKVMFLTFPLRYRTEMTLVEDGKRIDFNAYTLPNLHLSSTITFQPEGSGTRVAEQVCIEVMSPLAAYSVQQAQEAHKVLFANLKAYAEKAAASE